MTVDAGTWVMCGPCKDPTARLSRSTTSTKRRIRNATSQQPFGIPERERAGPCAPPGSNIMCAHILFTRIASLTVLSMATAAGADPPPARATVRPSVARLAAGSQQQFYVSSMAARLEAAVIVHNVKWSVNDVIGGNSEFGTIDSSGLYRAPAKTPTPSEIRVGAQVEGVGNRFVWATVILGGQNPTYRLVRSWGEPLDKLERLRSPHSVTVAANGEVIVTDEGSHRVIRYSAEGKFLGYVGYGSGREPGQFTKPRHAAVDREGRIWVSDEKSDRPRLQVFSPEGEFSRILAEKGTGPGMLLRAHGMQFDRQHRLFVVDVDNARVNVYDSSGKFLFDWGKDGL